MSDKTQLTTLTWPSGLTEGGYNFNQTGLKAYGAVQVATGLQLIDEKPISISFTLKLADADPAASEIGIMATFNYSTFGTNYISFSSTGNAKLLFGNYAKGDSHTIKRANNVNEITSDNIRTLTWVGNSADAAGLLPTAHLTLTYIGKSSTAKFNVGLSRGFIDSSVIQ